MSAHRPSASPAPAVPDPSILVGLGLNGVDYGLDREVRCLIDRETGLSAEDLIASPDVVYES